jgi:hypothetical protein
MAENSGFNFSAALYHAHHDCLTVTALHAAVTTKPLTFGTVHIPRFSTDVGLVNLYFAVWTLTKFSAASLQAQTDAMQHKPCRLLSNADSTGDLIARDSVAAIRQHPNGNDPLLDSDRRILEYGSDLGGKLPFGMDALALPFALVVEEHNVSATAGRASHNAVGPAQKHHIGQCIVGIRVKRNCLLQSLWLVVFAVHVSKVLQES